MNLLKKALSNYHVEKTLGKGAGSYIFEVRQEQSEKPYAVKYVPIRRKKADRRLISHLENEYQALKRVHGHNGGAPQVVRPVCFEKIRRFFALKGAYMIMERVWGESLARRHDYTLDEYLSIFQKVCDALRSIHESGLVHADVKADNIIVGQQLSVKLIDLGFAAEEGTELSGIKGTVGYLAPEQAGGSLGRETDVFNLGAAMYWALTGDQLPNLQGKGGTQMGLGHSHEIDPVPPWKLNPEVPQDLSHLVMRCCSHSPDQRPALKQLRNSLHNIALCRELKRSDQ